MSLTPEQSKAVKDGFCPICAAPLLNGRDEPCPECGCAAHLSDEEYLDLSDASFVSITYPREEKEEDDIELSEPDEFTKSFPLLIAIYTWWGHGWLAGIGACIGYLVLLWILNVSYMFSGIGVKRDWVKDLQRIKWTLLIVGTLIIGVL